MILGVGTDILEIGRIEKACKQTESFAGYTFTEEERRYAKGKASFLAGCFTVKEAVAKSLGTGFSGFGPKDIEVLRDSRGKPYVKLYNGAEARFRELGGKRIEVSISDSDTLATAFAVLEG